MAGILYSVAPFRSPIRLNGLMYKNVEIFARSHLFIYGGIVIAYCHLFCMSDIEIIIVISFFSIYITRMTNVYTFFVICAFDKKLRVFFN